MDALRAGLLTSCRQQFSMRYCNRQLVPTLARRRDGGSTLKYNHSGCSHTSELHALLKQVIVPSLPSGSLRGSACVPNSQRRRVSTASSVLPSIASVWRPLRMVRGEGGGRK